MRNREPSQSLPPHPLTIFTGGILQLLTTVVQYNITDIQTRGTPNLCSNINMIDEIFHYMCTQCWGGGGGRGATGAAALSPSARQRTTSPVFFFFQRMYRNKNACKKSTASCWWRSSCLSVDADPSGGLQLRALWLCDQHSVLDCAFEESDAYAITVKWLKCMVYTMRLKLDF